MGIGSFRSRSFYRLAIPRLATLAPNFHDLLRSSTLFFLFFFTYATEIFPHVFSTKNARLCAFVRLREKNFKRQANARLEQVTCKIGYGRYYGPLF
jgi:hypothetical protein